MKTVTRCSRSTVLSAAMLILATAVAYPGQESPVDAIRRDGEAFLAANKSKEGVVTLESGLQYKVLREGTGKRPAPADTVICHFRGAHIDGTEFASSYGSKKPPMFSVERVIKGWREALQLMPVGSKWQLFVPSALAYGERGIAGRVAPNATVVFDVELVAIKPGVADRTARVPDRPLREIRVSFKLDPRLTQGLYMGERWVSPPAYHRAGDGTGVSIDAKAEGVDIAGAGRKIVPAWTAADPSMVTITPVQGSAVSIAVRRVGKTIVTVTAHGVTKELGITAHQVGGVIQVEVTNGPAGRTE